MLAENFGFSFREFFLWGLPPKLSFRSNLCVFYYYFFYALCKLMYFLSYKNEINARDLIGQSAMVY